MLKKVNIPELLKSFIQVGIPATVLVVFPLLNHENKPLWLMIPVAILSILGLLSLIYVWFATKEKISIKTELLFGSGMAFLFSANYLEPWTVGLYLLGFGLIFIAVWQNLTKQNSA